MTDRDQPIRSAMSVAVRSAVNREARGVFIMFNTHAVSTLMAARNISFLLLFMLGKKKQRDTYEKPLQSGHNHN